jgi:hypothetical protein
LLQATAGSQPEIQVDGSLLFDGADDYMLATISLAQPFTIYILGRLLANGTQHVFASDLAGVSAQMYQNGVDTGISVYANGADELNAPVNYSDFVVLQGVFNGDSSVLQIDDETVANAGSIGTDGLTAFLSLGAYYDGTIQNPCQMQVKEILLYSAAHDATQRAEVRAYLKSL